MKRVMKIVMGMVMCVEGFMAVGQAKMDEQRMEQDIEVAENILSTLIRQQSGILRKLTDFEPLKR